MIDAPALAAWLGADEVVVDGAPTGGGWSNDTVFVRADGRPLVVRLTPSGPAMFPRYDLGQQVRAMGLAASAGGLPVPEVLGYEPDPARLGRPFFVMVRLAGRVPADDDPPFTKAGFLFDAAPEHQRAFHDAAVARIAEVQRIAPPAFVPVGPTLASHLDWCAQLRGWSGLDDEAIAAAHDALVRTRPADDPAIDRFLWGDARPANMVLDEHFAVIGLLDWELACSGPGELDVAWFCEMNRMRAEGMGIPPLPGFPEEATTWAQWSAAVGRPPRHVEWHQGYAAYKVAVLMQLFLRVMVESGRLPAGHRLLHDNPGIRRLGELFA